MLADFAELLIYLIAPMLAAGLFGPQGAIFTYCIILGFIVGSKQRYKRQRDLLLQEMNEMMKDKMEKDDDSS